MGVHQGRRNRRLTIRPVYWQKWATVSGTICMCISCIWSVRILYWQFCVWVYLSLLYVHLANATLQVVKHYNNIIVCMFRDYLYFQHFHKRIERMLGGGDNPKLNTLKNVNHSSAIIKIIHNYFSMCIHLKWKMEEVESQLESEQLLQELDMQPSSIHKAPTNRYQHFVNAYVLTNQTMKWADVVKCAQVEWKEQVVESEDQYVAALRKAAEHLKHNRMKRIDSF